jgi:hypothetical protein
MKWQLTSAERGVLRALASDTALVATRPPSIGFYSVVTAAAAAKGDITEKVGHRFQPRTIRSLEALALIVYCGPGDTYELTPTGKTKAGGLDTESETTEQGMNRARE